MENSKQMDDGDMPSKDPDSAVKYKVDDVYEAIGPLGAASVIYTLVICFCVMLHGAFVLGPVFQLRVPGKHCLDGNCTVGMTNEEFCEIPRTSWEWDIPDRTLISKYDLLCHLNYAKLASSLFFVPGMVIGLPLGGFLQDRFGRKKTNIYWTLLTAVSCLGEALSPLFESYLFFRVLGGVSLGATMSGLYIWCIEFFSERKRPAGAIIVNLGFDFGALLLPLMDYYMKSTVSIDITFTVMACVSIFLFCLLPESPHWLVTNQKDEEARSVLTSMARINRSAFPMKEFEFATVEKHKESGNLSLLIKDRKSLLLLAVLIYQWFIISMMFYGFYFALSELSGSFHLNSVLMGISELPFSFVVCYFVSSFGRKKSLLGYLAGVVVCCMLCLIHLDLGHSWNIKRVCALIGSRAVAGQLFYIIYLQTAELLPTSLRSSGTNLCSVSARVGAFLAPYVIGEAVKVNEWLYFVIFSVISVIGLGLGTFLPETKGKTLSSTLTNDGTQKCSCNEDV